MSFGVYSGITASYTSDKGVNKDPRYHGRFEAKFALLELNSDWTMKVLD